MAEIMRVVHVNTILNGGAARAALGLHEGLSREGIDSHLITRSIAVKKDANIHTIKPNSRFVDRVKRRLREAWIKHQFSAYDDSKAADLEIFSDDRSEYGDEIVQQLPSCDIINLHWVPKLIDYSSFFKSVDTPIVWTLHDMNAFTGGCHYTDGCRHFYDSCGACPQLGSTQERDLSRAIWHRKYDALSKMADGRLHIVTASKWLKKEVCASSLLKNRPVTVIPYGIDTATYSPCDSGEFRSALNIPDGAKVVLFVADFYNRRKGVVPFLEALQSFSLPEEMFFISVGSGYSGRPLANHIHLGRIDSDVLMSVVYSISDILVTPTLEDNLPLTVLESMACGTPVVGFNLGGLPDMVRSGQTGQLVETANMKQLCEAMIALAKDSKAIKHMSLQCREVAVSEYDMGLQANRYASLYQSMTQK